MNDKSVIEESWTSKVEKELTEVMAGCNSLEELGQICEEYRQRAIKQSFNLKDPDYGFDMMRIELEYMTLKYEYERALAIKILENPKATEEEILFANRVVWFSKINTYLQCNKTEKCGEKEGLGILKEALAIFQYPDGRYLDLEEFLSIASQNVLSLD